MKHEEQYRDKIAAPFYSSKAWQDCRNAYARSQGYICERCRARGLIVKGDIVHHIKPLDSRTINDPAVCLSWSNLMLVCRKCHAELHSGQRWVVDSEGRITATAPVSES